MPAIELDAVCNKEEINHPDRYKNGGYECIDVMEAIFGKEAVMAFCKLNAFKYIWRSEKKGHTEDLKKAIWYLNKNVELAEGKADGKDTVL